MPPFRRASDQPTEPHAGIAGDRIDSPPTPDPLEADYAILAFTMNRSVIDHMLRSARRFGGDYERLILWGSLAHLNIAHLIPPGSLPSSLLDEGGRVPDAAGRLRAVRTSDLAQITDIPRETARRKLERLERDGWILRTDAGWLLDVERVDPALREFTLESIRRFLLRAARVMQAAADDVAAPERQAARERRALRVADHRRPDVDVRAPERQHPRQRGRDRHRPARAGRQRVVVRRLNVGTRAPPAAEQIGGERLHRGHVHAPARDDTAQARDAAGRHLGLAAPARRDRTLGPAAPGGVIAARGPVAVGGPLSDRRPPAPPDRRPARREARAPARRRVRAARDRSRSASHSRSPGPRAARRAGTSTRA